jgi:YggT family protein
MGVHDIPFALADVASSAQQFVSVFIGVYVLLILVYILLSWIPVGASGAVEPVRRFLHEVCDPYLRLFRRFIPPLGPLDLSPIVAIVVLTVGERVINSLIGRVT